MSIRPIKQKMVPFSHLALLVMDLSSEVVSRMVLAAHIFKVSESHVLKGLSSSCAVCF